MARDYTVAQLKEMAKKKKILGYSKLRKNELLSLLGLGGKVVRKTSPQKQRPRPQSPQYYKFIRKECPILRDKKYANRPGPPRPANDPGCRGKIFRGNDGKWYGSKPNKNGVFRWVKVE